MMIVSIVLNIILVPQDIKSLGIKLAGLGGTGSAIATVVAYLVGLLSTRVVAFRVAHIKGNYRILLHIVTAALMGLIIYYITTIFYIGKWYELIGISLFGLFIYFGILFLLKEFNKEDYNLFLDTLNIKKMVSYMISEVRKK
jgi:O-antigen/teichoic acid export membrane protein